MNLREAAEKTEGVDKKTLEAIDFKINEDMQQVISKMDNIEKSIEKSVSAQFRTLYWVIGVAFALITVMFAFLAIK